MSLRYGREFVSIPGPSVMPDRVLQAMHRPAPNIYEGEVLDITYSIQADLNEVVRTGGDSVLLIANGHGAWEAAISNCFRRGDRALALNTGRFGEGWGSMARKMGVEIEVMDFGQRGPIDPDRLEQRLRRDDAGDIRAVMAVQVDTASSVVNDIPAIRAAMDAAGHDALLMVDCIACLGCVEYRMDEWGVDVTVSATQKGLMTPPGMSFNHVGPKAWEAHARSDLRTGYWDWKPRVNPEIFYEIFAGTAPTHHLFALREALDMLLREEGLEAAWRRHGVLADAVRACVAEWAKGGQIEFNVEDPAFRSDAVTTILTGEVESSALRALARDEANLVLGIGLGEFRGRAFRIGHMGWLNPPMLMGTLGTTEAALRALDAPIESGLGAAASVLGAGMAAGSEGSKGG